MKLYLFPPENVHKRTGKTMIKVTTDVAFVGLPHAITGKARLVLRFSAACSVACCGDVIFGRSLSYSCSFLIKMRFRIEKKSRDDRIHQPGKRLLKKGSKKNAIFYVMMRQYGLQVRFQGKKQILNQQKSQIKWNSIFIFFVMCKIYCEKLLSK